MLNIRQNLLTVSQDIISTNNLTEIPNNLQEIVQVRFNGEYPQPNETLLALGKINAVLNINNAQYNFWTEEVQKSIDSGVLREYEAKTGILHSQAFESFSIIIEFCHLGFHTSKSIESHIQDFGFYYSTLVTSSNDVFNLQYNEYWRIFFLRVKYVMENPNQSNFSNSFLPEARNQLLIYISALNSLT